MSGPRIDAAELWGQAMGSFVRAFPSIRAEKQRRIRVAAAEAVQAYTGPDGLAIPAAAATKP
jgi:hypothetical protein